jgi:hypothetical protein
MANRASTNQMIRTARKSKNSCAGWDLCIFIGSVDHIAGGRFALSASLPAAQQKMCVKAGGQAFNGHPRWESNMANGTYSRQNKTTVRF